MLRLSNGGVSSSSDEVGMALGKCSSDLVLLESLQAVERSLQRQASLGLNAHQSREDGAHLHTVGINHGRIHALLIWNRLKTSGLRSPAKCVSDQAE